MPHSARLGAENSTAKFRIVPLRRENYAEWDQFCRESPEAWFWHTTDWLEYTLHYRPELQPRTESFLCLHEGNIAAVCPLILESKGETDQAAEFSYGGDAGPAPAFAENLPEKIKKAVVRAVFEQVDFLANKQNVARIAFRSSPLAAAFWGRSAPAPNPLVRLGFNDISLATQILDLQADDTEQLRGMRKGHRADITRAEKLLQATVLDKETVTQEAFDRYRELHRKAAGRVTRPLATFQMMHDWIRNGLAVLCSASLGGVDVGFALVSVYKDGAYYSSSCEDPDHNDLPIGHLMQWRILQWLRQHGIRRYEIGWQMFASQPHAVVSEKELRIAFFKRGFGGTTVPLWQGEKFYSSTYCAKVLKERAARYSETVTSPGRLPG
jgi:hypothetical protein